MSLVLFCWELSSLVQQDNKKGAHHFVVSLLTWKVLVNHCGNKHEKDCAVNANFPLTYSPAKNLPDFPSENKSAKLNWLYF